MLKESLTPCDSPRGTVCILQRYTSRAPARLKTSHDPSADRHCAKASQRPRGCVAQGLSGWRWTGSDRLNQHFLPLWRQRQDGGFAQQGNGPPHLIVVACASRTQRQMRARGNPPMPRQIAFQIVGDQLRHLTTTWNRHPLRDHTPHHIRLQGDSAPAASLQWACRAKLERARRLRPADQAGEIDGRPGRRWRGM